MPNDRCVQAPIFLAEITRHNFRKKKKKKEERDIEATITCCCQQQGVGRQSFGGARSRTHIPHPFARTMASLNTLFGVDMMLREDIY